MSTLKTEPDTLLAGMIRIPVDKPQWYNQCGQWSIVYPSEHTRKERLSHRQTNKTNKKS